MATRLPRISAKWWVALLLVALGGVLSVIEQRGSAPPGPVPEGETGEPDYYLEDAELTRFDSSGQPYQRLATPRLEHTPGDDVTRLDAPDGRLIDAKGRVWFATADKGRLDTGGNPLFLTGDAQLQSPGEGWRINSQTLVYDADQRHAWSDSEAVLHKHRQRVSGERFDAWIDTGRMRVTGDVHGFHPPISQQ